MKIGHYTPWLSAPGGITSYLRRIVAGQLAHGHEVTLFNRLADVLPPEPFRGGAEVVGVGDDADLLRQARVRKLDVLHTHTAVEIPNGSENTPDGPALVRTMHGHEAYCPSGSRYLARPTERPCPRGCHLLGCTWGHLVNRCGSVRPDRILGDFARTRREYRSAKHFFTITISRFAREQLIRAAYDATRIRLVLNPAPAPAPAGPEPSLNAVPYFLYAGRLTPTKGVHWLLEAAARLPRPFALGIAGVGSQEPDLRRLAQRLRLDDCIEWLGWLDETQVRAAMTRARAVVFPSLWHEPAGLILAEAAAVGRAVIASEVGGIPEYAGKLGNALLVAPNDIPGLAGAMAGLAADADRAAELGRTGWQRLQAGVLGLDRHLDELEETYAGTRGVAAREGEAGRT
jgi:glycosyltransferase involved in cell wall biosynthesis